MELPILHTVCDQSLENRLLHLVLENTTPKTLKKLGELARQMADCFIALHYFHSVFVHGLLNSRLATSFSPIDGFHRS